MWQALRTELTPGLEIVTVALDVDAEAARPFIEAAQPEHPSLIDPAHIIDELFGFVNVPNGVWIDEDGTIVRPRRARLAATRPRLTRQPADIRRRPGAAAARRSSCRPQDPNRADQYVGALRDWVARGATAPTPSPAEVMARSPGAGKPRRAELVRRARHSTSGTRANGRSPSRYWREAHRFSPTTGPRSAQAWSLADPLQGPTEHYDSCWAEDVKKIGGKLLSGVETVTLEAIEPLAVN